MTNAPLPRLPERQADSHKGDYGRVLLIGGSQGMAGAIALAGMACLRSGAGLVHLAIPRAIQTTVASFEPAYMTHGLSDDLLGRFSQRARAKLRPLIEVADVVALGPGIARSVDVQRLVVELYQSVSRPMVVDADALYSLGRHRATLLHLPAARVLTPHPGEFRRLVSCAPDASREQLEATAIDWAAQTGAVLVLKGHRSLITDGTRIEHNTTGNPGLAKGGSGDVLTGVIAALLAQGLAPFEAARLACHVHGRAADLAVKSLGQISLTAGDLLQFLPVAFHELA